MAETTVIASQATGPPGWLQRFADDQWPVLQEDLDRVIEQLAEERGMRVLSVGDAKRRGPLPIHNVIDGHMTDDVIAETAQLFAYVEWEPITNGDG